MLQVKKHYEKYWTSKYEKDTFLGYERNWVLPKFFKKGDLVLDVGCGDGAVGEYLIKNVDINVEGLDISKDAVSKAKKRGIKAKVGDLEKRFPFPNQTFDVVFWGDNAEHLFKPRDVLKEISRVLKTNGRLILSCPNMGYWRYRLHYLFRGMVPDSEYSGQPPWSWGHIRFFNKKVIENFLATEGFKIKKIVGVSRRRIDRSLLGMFPEFFGMIYVVEASL